MYTKQELKELKKDLLRIELEIIEDLELIKISSNCHNRYSIDTVFGKYNFYFDECSIFGRFEDISKYDSKLPNKFKMIDNTLYSKKYNINPYTGKFNFHYNDIYNFQNELYAIVLIFQD